MPTPIELALSTLLPTVSFLPPELIALANSLLSQSRAKAASLKPEEEIGRTYTCAHIACQRLAKRLNLDIERPKPPCKPKVYQKLYTYLDSALGTPRTPTTGGRKRDALAGGGMPSQNSTPSKNVTPSKNASTSAAGSNKRKRTNVEEEDQDTPRQAQTSKSVQQDADGLPEYVSSITRAICKATSTSKAAPHVLVGVKAVKAEIESRAAPPSAPEPEPKRRRRTPQSAKSTRSVPQETARTEVVSIKYPALILALHTITCARMRGLEISDERCHEMKREGMKISQEKSEFFPQDMRDRLANRTLEKDIGFYILEAEDCGWMDMEWYKNVPEDDDWQDEEEEEEDETVVVSTPSKKLKSSKTPLRRKEKHAGKKAVDLDDQDEMPAAGLLPGLGTMFQPAIDWLSDERREQYRQWKKEIMKQIVAIEAGAA